MITYLHEEDLKINAWLPRSSLQGPWADITEEVSGRYNHERASEL